MSFRLPPQTFLLQTIVQHKYLFVFQGKYMEGRHCLSAATVVSGLAGEVPSEAAAQESKYLLLIAALN